MKLPSYKTRGLSNGVNSLSTSESKKEETSWNTYIFWGLCGAVVLILLIYLGLSPGSYQSQAVVVGQERITQLEENKRNIPIIERPIRINDQDIYVRESRPTNQLSPLNKVDLLFLHGKKYSSSTWKGLGTLQIFAYYGYRTVAIDLPGYGLSKKHDMPETTEEYVTFLDTVISKLNLRKVVIVTPSMSGAYALPYLMSNEDSNLAGVICIAPDGTSKFQKQDYQKISIPVLLLWGERDRTPLMEESRYYLQNIPNSEQMMVPSAEHAAFVGNPKAFHTYILSFLSTKCKLGGNGNINNGKKEIENSDSSNDFDRNNNEDWYDNDVVFEDEYDYDYDMIGNMFDDINDWEYDYYADENIDAEFEIDEDDIDNDEIDISDDSDNQGGFFDGLWNLWDTFDDESNNDETLDDDEQFNDADYDDMFDSDSLPRRSDRNTRQQSSSNAFDIDDI